MSLLIRGLRRCVGEFSLDGITLAVGTGEHWALLGPSGSGKTLLLHAIAGLHPLDGGTVEIEGHDVTRLPPERRKIGLVFQKAALFPHLDVRGNVAYGLRPLRMSREEKDRRVAELVELLGLGPILERPVVTLSGGEAQRVAIARALAPRPRVLLLDEPFGQLDAMARLELQEELTRVLDAHNITSLHVTHHLDEARRVAHRAAILVAGRLLQHGLLEEVLQDPRCPFVARFLGVAWSGHVAPPCAAGCQAPVRCTFC